MRALFLISCVLVSIIAGSSTPLKAQVHFSYAIHPAGDGEYELQVTAEMDKGWHIYSLSYKGGGTGTATRVSVAKNPLIAWLDAMQERSCTAADEGKEPVQKRYYQGKVCFTRKFKKNTKAKTLLKGTVYYQICTDKACLPPDEAQFSVAVP